MDDYSDIISLPHPEPYVRARMSMRDRAAQFAPFAALSGHSEAMAETARQTEEEAILNEDKLNQLNQKMQILIHRLNERPMVSFTYFVPDSVKNGGQYKSVCGIVQRIDDYSRTITLESGEILQLQYIHDIKIQEMSKDTL